MLNLLIKVCFSSNVEKGCELEGSIDEIRRHEETCQCISTYPCIHIKCDQKLTLKALVEHLVKDHDAVIRSEALEEKFLLGVLMPRGEHYFYLNFGGFFENGRSSFMFAVYFIGPEDQARDYQAEMRLYRKSDGVSVRQFKGPVNSAEDVWQGQPGKGARSETDTGRGHVTGDTGTSWRHKILF